jgi:hypothetical protein
LKLYWRRMPSALPPARPEPQQAIRETRVAVEGVTYPREDF